MQETHDELVVLEEGHEAGVVMACCSSAGSAKIK
jgi:hypothetical protein